MTQNNLSSLKQQMLETIENALGELTSEEFLLFVGWLEGVARQEQAVALAVRGE